MLKSDIYPKWKGNLFVGSLSFQYLERIELVGTRVIKREKILNKIGRVRNVIEGPDGYLYVSVERKGIFKIIPDTNRNIKKIMSNLFLKIREIIKKPYFKYVIITIAFIIWMTFLDTNSFQIHNELNNEIDMLEKKKQALIEETKKDKELINKLKDIDSLEQFARENYNLKRDNEEIFIIEYEENE